MLIVGHSNTIPAMLRRFGLVDYPLENLPDNEYDNFFIVSYYKGKVILHKEKYGKSSSQSPGNGK